MQYTSNDKICNMIEFEILKMGLLTQKEKNIYDKMGHSGKLVFTFFTQ